jgi:hypothetical protein
MPAAFMKSSASGCGSPDVAVAFGLVMLGEAERPGVHPVDVGEAAGREGAQQVQLAAAWV